MDAMRRRCSATNQSGEQCKKLAIPGGTVCYYHGGAAKQVRAAAERNLQKAEVERQIERLGIKPREIGYQDALLEELWRSAGWVDYLEQRVQAEGAESLTQWGMGGRTASALWAMLEEERKRFVAVAVACGRAGIEERRVQLAEQQGKMLAQVVRQIVTGLGHDLHDEAVQSVVRPALQLVRSAA